MRKNIEPNFDQSAYAEEQPGMVVDRLNVKAEVDPVVWSFGLAGYTQGYESEEPKPKTKKVTKQRVSMEDNPKGYFS